MNEQNLNQEHKKYRKLLFAAIGLFVVFALFAFLALWLMLFDAETLRAGDLYEYSIARAEFHEEKAEIYGNIDEFEFSDSHEKQAEKYRSDAEEAKDIVTQKIILTVVFGVVAFIACVFGVVLLVKHIKSSKK